jgi:ribosome-associated protein
MTPKKKAKTAADALVNKKAQDVMIMSLRKVTDFTNYFVICTGESELHLKALARDIEESIGKPWHIEGYSEAHWILLDYVDVVVHCFLKTTREYYTIEELWGNVPTETVT